MGADSLCIKDMAGLLTPYKAAELVQALKEGTKLPIDLHTHYTSGVASMTYLKAVEAGCEIIDCAMSPLALGTSQPARGHWLRPSAAHLTTLVMTRRCWLRLQTTSSPCVSRRLRAAS